jgi:putative copper resistance protein D
MIAARAAHFASLILLVGIFVFRVFIAESAAAGAEAQSGWMAFRERLMWFSWLSLGVALASGVLWLVFVAASMSGKPLTDVFSQNVIGTVLTHTRFGRNWELRLLLIVFLAAFVGAKHFAGPRRWTALSSRAALLLSAAALVTVAGSGHAGVMAGWQGNIHLASDASHLLAAGAWLGGLVPLALLFAQARRAAEAAWIAIARTATLRFSTLGVIGVGTLVATGLVNTWFLVGTLPALTGTDYGRLLLIKLSLFAAMVSVAAINRLRLTPRLSAVSPDNDIYAARAVLKQLQRNALIEAALGVVILVVVGALGITPPATHLGSHSGMDMN